MSKNNIQHSIAENDNPPSCLTVVTNPMYDLPSKYPHQHVNVPTQPQIVHILVSSEIPIMPKNLIIHIDEEGPQSTMNVPNSQSAHPMTKIECSQMAEVAKISRDLKKRLTVVEGFNMLSLDDMCLIPDLVIPPKFKVSNFE